ncbi:MAG: hypothetical protein ACRBCS_01605 [Cellvibrionaceae bacterium]
MKTSTPSDNLDNVVDFFTGRPYSSLEDKRFIRLSPELDGLEMLYSNEANPEKLFSLKILCWALRADGDVVGLVPWLDDIVACTDIQDPLNGKWEGYYDPGIEDAFYEAPIHKIIELETAAEYYEIVCEDETDIVQEIPDMIGTHAVFSNNGFKSLSLTEIVSWRLHHDGMVCGMAADESLVQSTPVLPGDECLYPVQSRDEFRYYFQHHIANRLKSEDPEALAAISLLSEDSG